MLSRPARSRMEIAIASRIPVMSWHRWLAMSALLLAVACSAAPSREVALHAGRREWIGPFGSGVLDLREDSSFCLSVRNEHSDACLEVSGKWRPLDVSCMWPADRSKQVTLLVRDSHASHPNADEAATW